VIVPHLRVEVDDDRQPPMGAGGLYGADAHVADVGKYRDPLFSLSTVMGSVADSQVGVG
jgi:hypothetical protein